MTSGFSFLKTIDITNISRINISQWSMIITWLLASFFREIKCMDVDIDDTPRSSAYQSMNLAILLVIYIYIHIRVYSHMYIYICVCNYLFVYITIIITLLLSLYHIYVCMYVCMYVCVYICVIIWDCYYYIYIYRISYVNICIHPEYIPVGVIHPECFSLFARS